MTILGKAMILVGLTALSACGTTGIASRNAPYEKLPEMPVSAPSGYQQVALPQGAVDVPPAPEEMPQVTLDYRVGKVTFRVPEDTSVSEANLYYPLADIVWRGDPIGNRPAQVGAIFREAIERSRPALQGSQVVDLEITLKRFHSVSEKARYSVGGVHNIMFDLILRDPVTGRAIGGVGKSIKADLEAFGGNRAIAADQQGLTMKERITRHLQTVFTAELTHPGGFIAAQPKLSRALDQI